MQSQMPEETAMLIEQFLRDMPRLGAGVFGLAYVGGAEPAMTLLRNRQGSPVEQAEAMLHIIKDAVADKRVAEFEVKLLN